MVQGWLLIVPREHFISSGAAPESLMRELRSITEGVYRMVEATYGSACIFEHGAVAEHRAVGCGVDHAHVHVAPIAFDLMAAVSPLLPPEVTWQDANASSRQDMFRRGSDYLYIEQPLGRQYIAASSEFGSQLFRRAIATTLGIPEQFNWRDFPQLPNVQSTADTFRAAQFREQIRRELLAV